MILIVCQLDQLSSFTCVLRESQESEGQGQLLGMVFSVMIEVCG